MVGNREESKIFETRYLVSYKRGIPNAPYLRNRQAVGGQAGLLKPLVQIGRRCLLYAAIGEENVACKFMACGSPGNWSVRRKFEQTRCYRGAVNGEIVITGKGALWVFIGSIQAYKITDLAVIEIIRKVGRHSSTIICRADEDFRCAQLVGHYSKNRRDIPGGD